MGELMDMYLKSLEMRKAGTLREKAYTPTPAPKNAPELILPTKAEGLDRMSQAAGEEEWDGLE